MQSGAGREVAVTFDDLPVAGMAHDSAGDARMLREIITILERHRVPAIGFVNEGKLYLAGKLDEGRVESLKAWIEAGLELGNHTYSHLDLHQASLEDYEQDVLRGEEVIRKLLVERGTAPRYFRHPFLHTGRDPANRAQFEAFLRDHGYHVAPVTIDNEDYVFAGAFARALDHDDRLQGDSLRASYLDYMDRIIRYYEQQSVALLGREIRQVLLLHASRLNAAALAPLLAGMESRGYAFITLDRALEDSAFGLPDRYDGPAGITWLHRWALTRGERGVFFAGEPTVPEWVVRAARGLGPPGP
jgi:peptidoglycan/xylan/chitin deacetylase (PgdA/CDA1 family)